MAIARLMPAAAPCVGQRYILVFRFGLLPLRRAAYAVRCAGKPTIRTSHSKALLPREIHLWYVLPNEVTDSHLFDQYLDLLSPSERDSILSMKDKKLQKDALLSRVLVRTSLSRYMDDSSPKLLKFRKSIFGKPELDWEDCQHLSSLQFNLSHTPSLIACGVSDCMQIGIDVEGKDRRLRNNILSFAKRYFTPEEVSYLQQFSDSDVQREEFIKIWTLKEAYVKALGRGFSAAPFRDFMIRFKPSAGTQGCVESNAIMSRIVQPCTIQVKPCVDVDYLTTNWQFLLLELAKTHYVAICVERDEHMADEGSKPPLLLKIWKTVPLVGEEVVLETEISTICGFS